MNYNLLPAFSLYKDILIITLLLSLYKDILIIILLLSLCKDILIITHYWYLKINSLLPITDRYVKTMNNKYSHRLHHT